MAITVIGDVHGKFSEYSEIVKNNEYTFQLGDFGCWDQLKNSNIDGEKHKVGQGNHDPHEYLQDKFTSKYAPYFVGRHGLVKYENNQSFYWIGGGYSVDYPYRWYEWARKQRSQKLSWHWKEQLNYSEMQKVISDVIRIRPEVIISHSPPGSWSYFLTGEKSEKLIGGYGLPPDFKDMTAQFLDHLKSRYCPSIWVSGHFHQSFSRHMPGFNCDFISLAELEHVVL